jgi:uncharacterized membrane protein
MMLYQPVLPEAIIKHVYFTSFAVMSIIDRIEDIQHMKLPYHNVRAH